MSLGCQAEVKIEIIITKDGKRKTAPVAESILGPVTADVPISYWQKFAAEGGNMIYVLDAVAAEGLKGKEKELKAKGVKIIDKTK